MTAAGVTLNAGKAISESAVFVTGTDTGVGKTVVSATLAVAAAARGLESGYLKPIQTGIASRRDASPQAHPIRGIEDLYSQRPDADFVASVASSRGLYVETKTTYSLPLPAAPLVAAREAGESIELGRIEADFEELQERCDFIVVEGAGGILVPISENFFMADLAALLGLSCVIVCKPSLGTLNHTLLTQEAADRRGLAVVGLAIAGLPADPNPIEESNIELLQKLTGLELILVIPKDPNLDVSAAAPGSLGDLAVQVPRGFASPKNR